MHRLWILGVLSGLTLVGCGSKLSGVYEGNQPQPDAPENIRAAIAYIKLELKPSGRFIFRRLGMPWEGDWRQEDGKLKLTVDQALGREVTPGSPLTPAKIELTVKEDGTLVLSDSFVDPGQVVVMKRVTK